MQNIYVIECRKPDGSLDFTGKQPEEFFGSQAIRGITYDAMAKRIFSKFPDAILTGDAIANWPKCIDPRWTARPKTW